MTYSYDDAGQGYGPEDSFERGKELYILGKKDKERGYNDSARFNLQLAIDILTRCAEIDSKAATYLTWAKDELKSLLTPKEE